MNARQQFQYDRISRLVVERDADAKLIGTHYENQSTKINTDCGNGHEFMLHPSNFLTHGSWCPHCIRRTPEQFKKEFYWYAEFEKGGDVYGVYVDRRTRVLVLCKHGHVFMLDPKCALGKGYWCPKCGGNCPDQAREVFFNHVENMMKGSVVGNYVNTHTNVDIDCGKGHIFSPAPNNVVHGGTWCPYCYDRTPEQATARYSEYIESRGGNLLEPYINTMTRRKVDCGKGHIFDSLPNGALADNEWCPDCKESRGESEIRLLLEDQDIPHVSQYIHPLLPKKRFDFRALFNGQEFLIEYDGIQHFTRNEHFHRAPEDFQAQQERDLIKSQFCVTHNISLIRVPYTVLGNIKDHLLPALEKDDLLYFIHKDLYSDHIAKGCW